MHSYINAQKSPVYLFSGDKIGSGGRNDLQTNDDGGSESDQELAQLTDYSTLNIKTFQFYSVFTFLCVIPLFHVLCIVYEKCV